MLQYRLLHLCSLPLTVMLKVLIKLFLLSSSIVLIVTFDYSINKSDFVTKKGQLKNNNLTATRKRLTDKGFEFNERLLAFFLENKEQ